MDVFPLMTSDCCFHKQVLNILVNTAFLGLASELGIAVWPQIPFGREKACVFLVTKCFIYSFSNGCIQILVYVCGDL